MRRRTESARTVVLGCFLVAALGVGDTTRAQVASGARPPVPANLAEYLTPLDLGTVTFPTSGSAGARPYLEQGVAALHTLAYHDAAVLFREAQRIDPDFATAYWGEAMTRTTSRTRYPAGQQTGRSDPR